MTVEELRKRADVYFKAGAEKMYATEDGNFFYEHDKAYADAHSRQTGLKTHVIEPEAEDEPTEFEKLKNKYTVAQLKEFAVGCEATKKDDLVQFILDNNIKTE